MLQQTCSLALSCPLDSGVGGWLGASVAQGQEEGWLPCGVDKFCGWAGAGAGGEKWAARVLPHSLGV